MSWSGYNTEPSNFNFQVEKYADPYAKIAGVGCAGTNEGYFASKSVYVEPPYIIGGKHKRSKNKRSNSKRSNNKRTLKGGFRYGNKSKHTPIPGEVLISSPTTRTKTRTKTRTSTRTRTRKQFRFF